ncbi:hypothetical protein N7540_004788 [Penicillium herquei]|nr:hypothetical protein N7540_004788 [Penicillium herquei]
MEDIDFSIDETDDEVTALVGKFSELKAHRILQHYLETCQSDSNALSNACKQISEILSLSNQKKEKKQK